MKRITALAAALACVLVGGVAAAPGMPAPSAPPDRAEEDIAARLKRARRDAERARARVAAFDSQAQAATAASDRALIDAARLAAEVQESEADVAAARAELAVATARSRRLDARLAQEREPLAQLLAGLGTVARRPPLMSLLQPGSIEDAVHLRAVLTAVTPQIRDRTATLRGDLETARQLEAAATRAADARLASQARLEARRKTLRALADRQLAEARRATGSADREAERAYLASQQARNLASLLRRLETDTVASAAAGTPGAATADGPIGYRPPVAGAIRRAGGAGRGAELDAGPGAQVVAPAEGRIAFAGPYRGYGTIVIVDHGDGWVSLLTGLGAPQVGVGQRVLAGSPIGLAGSGSPSIGLELRLRGRPVDTLAALRGAR
ncbi:murein hydrolase activator EnvC family protein [Qipengyuania sp.]|uniref:murein hydrolase activator EnvC family protein n=1 Tax=Qipengyuania sp. TaxID=2004515 RepID=UPI0035C86C55